MRDNSTYGEFFPSSMSPFAYNETVAVDYFPLSKEEAISKGFIWREPEKREYHLTIEADKLPDHINDTRPEITKEIIGCASCKRAYRILDRELEFYQRLTLPLPRLCPNCRYTRRIQHRNTITLYDRTCAKCQAPVSTTFAPERKEIIYCEPCYQAEIS